MPSFAEMTPQTSRFAGSKWERWDRRVWMATRRGASEFSPRRIRNRQGRGAGLREERACIRFSVIDTHEHATEFQALLVF
jgi:hypothetical protein